MRLGADEGDIRNTLDMREQEFLKEGFVVIRRESRNIKLGKPVGSWTWKGDTLFHRDVLTVWVDDYAQAHLRKHRLSLIEALAAILVIATAVAAGVNVVDFVLQRIGV